ncbi:DgyrCDS8123 [Dimorphilus gyrociliatus]|uniref:DgyrCDS8123 n=1 Tax=Dimorphilus gyrociliatus TaxID=2664684 RepID=A0A7I8VT94_9ANNE|nr:DgyrCDS8123 [Dimorphilus gyrociliatus]
MFTGIDISTDNLKTHCVENYNGKKGLNNGERSTYLQKLFPKRFGSINRALDQILNGKVKIKRLKNDEIEKWLKKPTNKSSKTTQDVLCSVTTADVKEELAGKDPEKDNTFSMAHEQEKILESSDKEIMDKTFSYFAPLVNGKTMAYPKCGTASSNGGAEKVLEFHNSTIYYQCLMCCENKDCLVELIEHNVRKHLSESIMKCGYCFKLLNKTSFEIYLHQRMEHFSLPVKIEEFSLKKDACKRVIFYHMCLICNHSTLNVNHAFYHASQHVNNVISNCQLCSSIEYQPTMNEVWNKAKLRGYFKLKPQTQNMSGEKQGDFTFEELFEKKTFPSNFPLKLNNEISEFTSKEGQSSTIAQNGGEDAINKPKSSKICPKSSPSNENGASEVIDLRLDNMEQLNNVREKPIYYSCKICGANSSKKTRIEDHIKKHTNDYAYQCSQCSYKDKKELKRLCLKKCKFQYQFPTSLIKIQETIPLNFPVNHIEKTKLSSLTWTRMAFGKDTPPSLSHNESGRTFPNSPPLYLPPQPQPQPQPQPSVPLQIPIQQTQPHISHAPPSIIFSEPYQFQRPPVEMVANNFKPKTYDKFTTQLKASYSGNDRLRNPVMTTQQHKYSSSESHSINATPFPYPQSAKSMFERNAFYPTKGSNMKDRQFELNNNANRNVMSNLEKLERVITCRLAENKTNSSHSVAFHCRYCPHTTKDPSHLFNHINNQHKLRLSELDKFHLIRLSSQKMRIFPFILSNMNNSEFGIAVRALQRHWVAK